MGFTSADLQKMTMAAPCPASWRQMTGDDRIRHCGACDKRVFNLSTMTLHEVAELMQQDGPRPCLRFYLRKDGTVMTDDCPVGLRRLRRRAYLVVVATASLLGAAYTSLFGAGDRFRLIVTSVTRLMKTFPAIATLHEQLVIESEHTSPLAPSESKSGSPPLVLARALAGSPEIQIRLDKYLLPNSASPGELIADPSLFKPGEEEEPPLTFKPWMGF